MEQITWHGKDGEDKMGFDIRPGMSTWNSMSEKYKKEYHIYAAKMEKLKFENDRKIMQKEKMQRFRERSFEGLNKNAKIEEKKWYGWME